LRQQQQTYKFLLKIKSQCQNAIPQAHYEGLEASWFLLNNYLAGHYVVTYTTILVANVGVLSGLFKRDGQLGDMSGDNLHVQVGVPDHKAVLNVLAGDKERDGGTGWYSDLFGIPGPDV
jgi:hypothetical protein